MCQKRPTGYGKRDLFGWGKSPTNTGIPQVYVSVKRDLFIWQKRPIYMAKEAY